MKTRVSKKKAIELILIEIDKGLTFSKTLAEIRINFQLSERSFANYWNEANEIHSERRKSIEDKMMQERIEAEKEVLKSNVLTRVQRLELATRIALGEVSAMSGDNENTPTAGERMRALDYLSKINGDFELDNKQKTEKIKIDFTD